MLVAQAKLTCSEAVLPEIFQREWLKEPLAGGRQDIEALLKVRGDPVLSSRQRASTGLTSGGGST